MPCAASVLRERRVIVPALRRADRAGRQRHRGPAPARSLRARQAAISSAGTTSSGSGHSAGSGAPGRQGERGALVDHARQALTVVADVVEDAEAHLADEAGAFSDIRAMNGASAALKVSGNTRTWPYFSAAQALASSRWVENASRRRGRSSDDRLAHARHVVDQRRVIGRGEDVDRRAKGPAISTA